MSDNLDILVRLLLDERANKRVQDGLSSTDDELKKIEAHTSKSAKQLLEAGYTAETAAKRMRKEYEANTQGVKELDKATEKLAKTSSKVTDSSKAMLAALRQQRTELSQLRDVSEKLGQYSTAAFVTGAAITGGIFAAAQKYINDAKEATAVTYEWNFATSKLKESGTRVGAVMAQEALPLLRDAAKLAEFTAGIIEAHPEIIKAALNFGVAASLLGGIGKAVSGGIRLVADVSLIANTAQQLLAAKLHDQAANKELAAATLRINAAGGIGAAEYLPGAAGSASASAAITGGLIGTLVAAAAAITAGVIVSAVAVGWVNDLVNRSGLGKEIDDAQDRIRQTGKAYPGVVRSNSVGESGTPNGGSPGYGVSGGKIGPPQAYGVPGGKIGPPAIGASESAINQAVDAEKARLKSITDTAVELYAARESQIAEIEKQTEKQRTSIVESAGRERTNLEKQASKALSEYAKSERRYEEDYRRSRMEIAQAAGKEEARAEEDHQREMLRLKADHQMRSDDLVASGDALGFVLEQRRYEAERQQAESEHDVEVRRRNEDLADQLAQLEYSFRVQRARRRADFEQTLKDFEEQKKIIDENERRALEDLNQAHQEQLDLVEQNLRERLNKLDATLLGDQAAVEQASAEMAVRFRNWLQNASSSLALAVIQTQAGNAVTSTSTGGGGGGSGSIALRRAFGGYAEYGKYLLGDSQSGGPGRREFVLDGMATQAAEAAIGGQLSQAAIINAIRNNASNGGSSSRRVDYHDNRRFSGGISAQDRRSIARDTENILRDAFRED